MEKLSPETFSAIVRHCLDATEPAPYYTYLTRLLLVNRQWHALIDEDPYSRRVLSSHYSKTFMRRAIQKSGSNKIFLVHFERENIVTWFVNLVVPLFDRWLEVHLDWPLHLNFPWAFDGDQMDELGATAKLSRALLACRDKLPSLITCWGLDLPRDVLDTPHGADGADEEEIEDDGEGGIDDPVDGPGVAQQGGEMTGYDDQEGSVDDRVDDEGIEEHLRSMVVPPEWYLDLVGESLREARLSGVYSAVTTSSTPHFPEAVLHKVVTCPNLERLSLVNPDLRHVGDPAEPSESGGYIKLKNLKAFSIRSNLRGIAKFLSGYTFPPQTECLLHVSDRSLDAYTPALPNRFECFVSPVLEKVIQASSDPVLVLDATYNCTISISGTPSKFTLTAHANVARTLIDMFVALLPEPRIPIQIKLKGSLSWPTAIWPNRLASCPSAATSLLLASCAPDLVLDTLKELLDTDTASLPHLSELQVQNSPWEEDAPDPLAIEALLSDLGKARPNLKCEVIPPDSLPADFEAATEI